MKHLFSSILIAVVLAVLAFSCQPYKTMAPEVETALSVLDRALANKDRYYQIRENRISEFRRDLKETDNGVSRYSLLQNLYDEYLLFDKDSALFYAHKKDTLARELMNVELIENATLDLAYRYLVSGMYIEALETMNAFDENGPVTSKLSLRYYQTLQTLYHGLTFTITDPLMKGPAREKDLYYQEKLLKYSDYDEFNYVRLQAQRYMVDNEVAQARDSLVTYLNKGDHPIKDKSVLHYLIAKTYQAEGDNEHALEHYAYSASYDIINADKAIRSLVQAAKLMLKKGEVSKAYFYINVAYNGAIDADAHVCMEEVIAIMPDIASAYEQLNKRRIKQLSILLALLGVSLIVSLIAMGRARRMRKQIQKAYRKNAQMNKELEEAVARLKETSDIKDRYLWNYISVFSNHIGSLEEYRSMLRNVSKSMDINDIIKAIRNDDFIEDKRKKLYEEFDNAFLGIFPNFIEQLNALLKDGQHIGEGLPAGTLTNELRVFALIRLGVNESASIAHFLKKSPSTIYNYRVKLRNASIYPNEEFEKHLMDIGKL